MEIGFKSKNDLLLADCIVHGFGSGVGFVSAGSG